jgi:hypothetical protein
LDAKADIPSLIGNGYNTPCMESPAGLKMHGIRGSDEF